MVNRKILFDSFMIILLISFSTNNTNAQKIEEFKIIKVDSPILNKPAFDTKGNVIGNIELTSDFDIIEGISDISDRAYKAEINLLGGKSITINPIGKVIICEKENRIFTFGPNRLDHWWDGYPKLLIFDLKGNLVSNYGTAINGEYHSIVSKNGNIYFTGKSLEKPSKKMVLVKINKDGIQEWEREIPSFNGRINSLQISNESDKIGILRTNTHSAKIPGSHLTIIDEKGEIVQVITDAFSYNYFSFLSESKIFLTEHGNNGFGIKEIKDSNIKSFRYGVSMPDKPNNSIFIIPSSKGKYLGLLRRDDNSVFLCKLGKKNNPIIIKKIKLENIKGQKLEVFKVKDNGTIEIKFKDQLLTLK